LQSKAQIKRGSNFAPSFYCLNHGMELIEKIADLVYEKITSDDLYNDCFVLEVTLKSGNKLEVILDSDSAITLQTCQRISRHVEAALDENGWLGEKYVLEIGSAGITRPLEQPRQYIKNVGRTLKVKLDTGVELEALLIAADQDTITLQYEEVRKEGKKKIKEIMEPKFQYNAIKKAVVKISFTA
jgi:ribosome maturation factor RimP